MSQKKICPECGCECDRDEVDNGVGIMYGPWGCCACGWSEDSEYSHNPDPHIDSRGGYTPGVITNENGKKKERIIRHVCYSCCHPASTSLKNQSRTDWCDVCGHRSEGQLRQTIKGTWGRIIPLPDEKVEKGQ